MWSAMVGGVAVAVVLVVAIAARRYLVVVTVGGNSMTPTYRSGDRLLVRRRRAQSLRRGDIVLIAPDPPERRPVTGRPATAGTAFEEMTVKRIAALPGEPVPPAVAPVVGAAPGDRVPPGRLVVLGDGPESRDSREFGYVPAARVVGVVIRRLGPDPTGSNTGA
jgi:signal peptidase I